MMTRVGSALFFSPDAGRQILIFASFVDPCGIYVVCLLINSRVEVGFDYVVAAELAPEDEQER